MSTSSSRSGSPATLRFPLELDVCSPSVSPIAHLRVGDDEKPQVYNRITASHERRLSWQPHGSYAMQCNHKASLSKTKYQPKPTKNLSVFTSYLSGFSSKGLRFHFSAALAVSFSKSASRTLFLSARCLRERTVKKVFKIPALPYLRIHMVLPSMPDTVNEAHDSSFDGFWLAVLNHQAP